ncbi:hypothetical protein WJX73_005059 [Symbiochloris irregularis]|uniref:Nucleoside phosphorylase domain-containing protein n=1 Tax=Symbiochloris irregularis TaxID=706552 RepID=A0AAW1NY29_9CHLO
MEQEAAPLISGLGLSKDDPSVVPKPAPCISYTGTYSGLEVTVVCNGRCSVHSVDNVGTVPAAVAAYLAVQAVQPDLLINAGTAGGFKARGAGIGDIYVSSKTVNHDRRIPLSGFDMYGHWAIESTPAPNLVKALNLKAGVVSSGNSMDFVQADLDNMEKQGAAVKEMEAAGIAWSAHLFGTPFFALKSITDIVDGGRVAQEEFMENLATAAKALHDTLGPVLEFVASKDVSEL